jgi:hypothetical protein
MLINRATRRSIKLWVRTKRSSVREWWERQRVIPVVLGVYFGLRLWELL